VLSYRNNAPLAGDSVYTQDIDVISPGNAGPAQVWDFSNIRFTGEKNTSFLAQKPSQAIHGLDNFNTILNDKGYEYFYKIDENTSELTGLVNKDYTISLDDPIVKMKYPVLYGTSFKDEFNGTGVTKYKSGIAISGEYSVDADAYGTLILPDRIIKDALRLKIVETKMQINPCNIYQVTTTSYFWYAPLSRYPLLGTTSRAVSNNGQEPVVTNTSFINPDMCRNGILLAGKSNDDLDAGEVSLILYPNPFQDKLYYNYFLRKQLPVTVELVDVTGKTILSLVKEQMQSEGYHTGDLDAVKYDLKMGVYYFRFTFGDKVLVSKVVKM
jgi:hypothetical protein